MTEDKTLDWIMENNWFLIILFSSFLLFGCTLLEKKPDADKPQEHKEEQLDADKTQKNKEKQSAFVECMIHKIKETYPNVPDSTLPMARLQAQITERQYESLAEMSNESPTDIAKLELMLERANQASSSDGVSSADSIAMKGMTLLCSEHIKWTRRMVE